MSGGDWQKALPWDWDGKAADFIKPGDEVLWLRPGMKPSQMPPESCQVVLSRGPLWDWEEVCRLLRPGGFLLAECRGGEDGRALADFLVPGGRPADMANLENQLPLLRKAGFRVMFRSQAYPVVRFSALEDVLRYIAAFPERFPGFSRERCAQRLEKLSFPMESSEHVFLMIGKKEKRPPR